MTTITQSVQISGPAFNQSEAQAESVRAFRGLLIGSAISAVLWAGIIGAILLATQTA